MYSPGSIIRIENFEFKNKNSEPKDKYLIILYNDQNSCLVCSFPTRRNRTSSTLILKHGCNKSEEVYHSFYHFEKKIIIGKNNFCFPLPTFIYHNYDVFEADLNSLSSKYTGDSIQAVDQLLEKEYENLIYCILKSKHSTKKIKKILTAELEKFIKNQEINSNVMKEGFEYNNSSK